GVWFEFTARPGHTLRGSLTGLVFCPCRRSECRRTAKSEAVEATEGAKRTGADTTEGKGVAWFRGRS
ncbi:MAG: hypothetical protein WA705_01605, partial [Candidatus Ozemobacteraceae bacterium]